MSQQCTYKLQHLKTTVILHRHICTSRKLLQDKNDKNSDREEEVKQGFFARFKSELLKDIESTDTNKETLNKYKEQFEKFNSKYERYIIYLRKYTPIVPRNEKVDDEKSKSREIFIEKLKSRLEREQLTKDYDNFKDQLKNKTEDIKKKWQERKVDVTEPNTESSEIPQEKSKISENFKLKIKGLYDKSGIADSPIYLKAKDQTKSVFDVST